MPHAVASALGWAAMPALLAASVLLQPALAWRVDAAMPESARPGTGGSPASLPRWQAPMERLRVSAFFGIKHAPTGRPHGGMDFAARTGTPVVAPADGVVVASTSKYMGEDKWGELVAIEHANGLRSLYAHMDKRLVKEGERHRRPAARHLRRQRQGHRPAPAHGGQPQWAEHRPAIPARQS